MIRTPAILRALRGLLIILGWSTITAAFILAAVFQGLLQPNLSRVLAIGGQPPSVALYFLGIFLCSILVGILIGDMGRTLFSWFVTYMIAASITYSVLVLPASLGVGGLSNANVLSYASITITLTAFFPLVLFLGLVGSILGNALRERIL